jgi:hypothetical protein
MPCAPTGSLARPPYDFLRTDAHGHPLTCTHCGEALLAKMIGRNDIIWVTADGRAFDDLGEPPDYPGLGFPHPMIPWNRSIMHLAAPCPDPQAPLLPGVEAAPECCGLPMQLRDDGWRCREQDTLFPFAAAPCAA